MDEWQPISTAPKDRTIDLWVKQGGRVPDCKWSQKHNGWMTWGPNTWGEYGEIYVVAYSGEPTHWREIPDAPRDVK
jgi:hypothetical protein